MGQLRSAGRARRLGNNGPAQVLPALDRFSALIPGRLHAAGLRRPDATAELPAGSTLLLYTGGLVERRREVTDVGIERACAALAESRT
jgi:hypothetical protein